MSNVIDLHLTPEIINSPYYEVGNSLHIQLNMFERSIDDALVKGYNEIWIIHGIGEGILKKEIHKLLSTHPHVSQFINEYHPSYGWGATKVKF
jgi:dsDNA-specific endonuclease/ATPase MutS2